MAGWTVELIGAAAEEMAAMPADIRARFLRIVGLIEAQGLDRLREPYVKHVEGKLWEMRMTGKDGIARALYMAATGRRVMVLRVFEKRTQKTPRAEIELAVRRAASLP